MTDFENIVQATSDAQKAFINILAKLEHDGHLKSDTIDQIPVAIVEEIMLLAEELISGKYELKKEDGEILLPNGFLLLNRFDKMSQEFEGAFWKNHGVNRNLKLETCYMDLLKGYITIMAGDRNGGNLDEIVLPNAFFELTEVMESKMNSPYFS